MPPHVFGDGRLTHQDPQLLQLPVNPRRAPEGIRGRELANQAANLVWHGRTASSVSTLPGPEQTKAAPVPRDDGFRLDDVHGRAPAAPYGESHAHSIRSTRQTETWAARSVHDGQLVAEGDDFQVQRGS